MFRRLFVMFFAVSVGLVPGFAAAVPVESGDAGKGGSANASTYRFKVVSHNIAGGAIYDGDPHALDYVNEQIANPDYPLDAVMLQEVCANQRDVFREQHPDWNVKFSVMVSDQKSCRVDGNDNSRQGQMLASPHPISDVTNDDLGYEDVDHPDGEKRVKRFKLLCADLEISGHAADEFRACTTHLRAFRDEEADHARTMQMKEIRSLLHDRIHTDDQSVILGGDLNAKPEEASMDSLYHLTRDGKYDGAGDFHEGDQNDSKFFDDAEKKGVTCADDGCRSGEHTLLTGADHDQPVKYDHVFFSRNRVGPDGVSGLAREFGMPECEKSQSVRVEQRCSDHRLYRAYGDFVFD